MQQDLQQLKLLSIFYYIWGGLACLGAVIGAISLFVAGAAMSSLPSSSSEDAQSQAFMGPIFIVMGVVVLILGVIYGILAIMCSVSWSLLSPVLPVSRSAPHSVSTQSSF
jgi:hypothetical protein